MIGRQVHSELLQIAADDAVRMEKNQHECHHDDNVRGVIHRHRVVSISLPSNQVASFIMLGGFALVLRCLLVLLAIGFNTVEVYKSTCSTATPEARAATARCYGGWDIGDVGAGGVSFFDKQQ